MQPKVAILDEPDSGIDVGVSEQRAMVPYSIERARKELGCEPKYDIRVGLTDYVESCRVHIEALKKEG
jgi:Fe-S cluster assembly ATPase SufC